MAGHCKVTSAKQGHAICAGATGRGWGGGGGGGGGGRGAAERAKARDLDEALAVKGGSLGQIGGVGVRPCCHVRQVRFYCPAFNQIATVLLLVSLLI